MSKKIILLVEDNVKLLNVNKLMLESKGYAIETAATLAGARAVLEQMAPHAIILDRGMPDGDGIDFLAELRKTSRIPVLMLTGYRGDEDMLKGYDSGCDDYVTKPFSVDLMLRKLSSLLRRAEDVPEILERGGLTLRLTSREAYLNGVDLVLSPKEYSLLQYLIQNEGRVVDKETIYEAVWGQPTAGDARTVKVTASRLRKKLEGCGYTISSGYENGYCFERGEP